MSDYQILRKAQKILEEEHHHDLARAQIASEVEQALLELKQDASTASTSTQSGTPDSELFKPKQNGTA